MRSIRKIMTGMLIAVIALYSTNILAGEGLQYVRVYNDLLKGIQERGGLASTLPKPYLKTSSVTQGDLATLRGAVTDLAQDYFIEIVGASNTFSASETKTAAEAMAEAMAVFRPLYYLDKKDTEETSDDEWKFSPLDRNFIKVPAKYTKLNKDILANNFTDVPILWIHFSDMVTVLNAMEIKKENGNLRRSSSGDVFQGFVHDVNGTSGALSGPNPSSVAELKAQAELLRVGELIYLPWEPTSFTFSISGSGSIWLSYASLSISTMTSDPDPEPLFFTCHANAVRFYTPDCYVDMMELTFPNSISKEFYLLRESSGTTINTEFQWKQFSADVKHLITEEPPGVTWPLTPAYPTEKYASNFNFYERIEEYSAIQIIATYEFTPVKLTDPGKMMDSSGNDVVLAGCVTCDLRKGLQALFGEQGMSAEFPLGLSSGFDSGLIVFSFLSNYDIGGFRFNHHNLDTSIMGEYSDTESDGNQWQFTLVQRPRGAQVVMGWLWNGTSTTHAEAIAGGGDYTLKIKDSNKVITFGDGVDHVFSSSTGGLIRCEKMEDDELLKVSPPGSGLSVTDNPPTSVTSFGVLRSKPTYNTDGTCSGIAYYVVVLGVEIPFGKYVIEYTTQPAEDDPNVDVEVVEYDHFEYIDNEYKLKLRIRKFCDTKGNPTSEEWNVENGVVTTFARKTAFITTVDTEDTSITIIQKTVTEDANTFVTITSKKAHPWGNETIEEIEGYGSADEKTTSYDYYTSGDGYGKAKSVAYPDGTWVRYEYNSDGRETKVVRPVGNITISAAENLCRVTEYDYTAYVTGDTVSDGDIRPRMTVQKELGVEISRSYQGFLDHEYLSIRCQTAGAAWNAADNLITYKYSYTSGDFEGRHWKQVNPDGTMNITSYAKTATEFTTTVESGSGSGSTVSDGVRSIAVINTNGWTTSTQTVDIASGLTLSSAIYTHDDSGRVIRTDYADGTYTTTAYACCGPSQQVNREGTATDIMYDTLKRVINRETDGIATLYTYDANDRVLTSTVKGNQGAEQTTSNTYNTAGELVSSTTPDGATTTYSEEWIGEDDGNGGTVPGTERRYSTTTLPNGKTQITRYNLDGTPVESYGTAVRHVKYEYGIENGERYQTVIMVGENDSEAMWTKSYTNFAGANYKTVNSAGATVLTEYDNIGRPVKQTAPNGVISLTEYNAKGEAYVSAVDINQNGVIDYGGTDRINKNESLFIDKSGTVVNKRTNSVYATDGSATPTDVSVSEGAVDGSASWQTSFGNVRISQTVLGGSGAKTITVTNPDASTVVAVYQNGRMLTSIHSVLGLTTYTYDEFNRMSTVTHPEGGVDKVTTYTYNAAGQTDKITVSSGASSRETSYAYNNMGARTSVTLPGGRVVNYTYTDTGELATVSGSDTYPQAYTYDALGKMKTLTTYKTYPGTAEVTTWNYDAASGFMTSKIYDDGNGTTYTYNSAGQLLTRVWDRGITTSYGYDNAGAQNSIDYSDTTPDITFTYDRMGRITTVADVSGTRTQTYNAELKLESSSIPHILNGKLDYAYDTLGKMSSMKLMQDTTQKLINSYTYDAMSRIASVSDGTNTAEYTRLTGTSLLNSVIIKEGANTKLSTTKSYDAFNRLLSTSSVAGATTRTYSYEYNDKDQRTKLTLADGSTWEYTYDDKGQVTSGIKKDSTGTVIPGQSFNYTFDDIGNRLTEKKGMPEMLFNYTANNVNQYTQRTVPGIVPIAGSAATDAKVSVKDVDTGQIHNTTRTGEYFTKAIPVSNSVSSKEMNLEIHAVKFDVAEDKDIVKTVSGKYMVYKTPQTFSYDTDGNMTSDGKGWNYTWNGENRMVQAVKTDDTKIEFKYDFMGRRFEKKKYSWVSSAWQLDTTKKFVYNGFKQIAEYNSSDVLQKTYTWQPVSLDVPLWVKNGANYYYYIVDGNKNVRAMVDTSGNKVAQYDYNPFGKVVVSSGSYKDTNMYRFSSEYKDDETGLIYYNYRYYDANLGRWTKRDPIEEDGGANLYGFVYNNPIEYYDYQGMKPTKTNEKDKLFCTNAYNYAKKIFTEFATNHPACTGFYDCNDGSQAVQSQLGRVRSIREAFTVVVARAGAFRGPIIHSTTNALMIAYRTYKDSSCCLRYVRLHSVVSLTPRKKCKPFFKNIPVFDYLKNKIYTLADFEKEYPLPVSDQPGLYGVTCKTSTLTTQKPVVPGI